MKISIIIPVCKSRLSIDDCIQSIVKQSYPDIEVVMVDYCEADGIRQKALSHLPLVRYYGIGEKCKLNAALNFGIRKATGDVLCILKPEDQLPEKGTIQKVVNSFKESNANVVFGKGMTGNGNDILHTLRTFGSKPHMQKYLPFGKIPLHTSIYFKRNMLDELGYLDKGYKVDSEYELYLRLFMHPEIEPHFLDDFIVKICLNKGISHGKSSVKKNIKVRANETDAAFIKNIATSR